MKQILTYLVLLCLTVLLTACGTLFRDDSVDTGRDEKPWNAPTGWESQTIGVPY